MTRLYDTFTCELIRACDHDINNIDRKKGVWLRDVDRNIKLGYFKDVDSMLDELKPVIDKKVHCKKCKDCGSFYKLMVKQEDIEQ